MTDEGAVVIPPEGVRAYDTKFFAQPQIMVTWLNSHREVIPVSTWAPDRYNTVGLLYYTIVRVE